MIKICFVFLPCIKTKINKEGIILLLPFFMLLFFTNPPLHFTDNPLSCLNFFIFVTFFYLALFSRIFVERKNRRLSYNLACSQLTTALCLERQNWSAAISDAHARQPQSAASAYRVSARRRRRRSVCGAALSAESM